MSKCPECGEYEFQVGDDVEIITSGLKGRIANCDGTHTYFEVWIYGGGTLHGVPEHMIMHIGDDEYTPPVVDEADNVVSMEDYKLTKYSKTKGAA